MNANVKVDWVTLTTRMRMRSHSKYGSFGYVMATAIAFEVLEQAGIVSVELESIRPGRGYDLAFREASSGIQIHVSHRYEEQGVMIVMTGAVLAANTATLLAAKRLLDHAYRVSRLDIAVDLHDLGETVDTIAKRYSNRHPSPNKRKYTYIAAASGDTLYIGSRTSTRYLRVYDKAKQQGLKEDWLRVEIEVKGDYAHQAGELWINEPELACHDILEMLDDEPGSALHRTLCGLAEGTEQVEIVVGRPATNRELWFRRQVLPAFRKLIRESPDIARDILRVMADALD